MRLYSCATGGVTFALLQAPIADASRTEPVLVELTAAAKANFGSASAASTGPFRLAGMKGSTFAQHFALTGQRPDGQHMKTRVVLFAHGGSVYQATATGGVLDDDAVDTFFEGFSSPS
jgi:hypothetical protein